MKEKTFKELIDEAESEIFLHGYKYYSVHEVNNLLQQVREATIAECEERIIELEGEIYREGITGVFDVLPTDRIKLTEKSTVCSNQKRYIESQKDEDGYFRK